MPPAYHTPGRWQDCQVQQSLAGLPGPAVASGRRPARLPQRPATFSPQDTPSPSLPCLPPPVVLHLQIEYMFYFTPPHLINRIAMSPATPDTCLSAPGRPALPRLHTTEAGKHRRSRLSCAELAGRVPRLPRVVISKGGHARPFSLQTRPKRPSHRRERTRAAKFIVHAAKTATMATQHSGGGGYVRWLSSSLCPP